MKDGLTRSSNFDSNLLREIVAINHNVAVKALELKGKYAPES